MVPLFIEKALPHQMALAEFRSVADLLAHPVADHCANGLAWVFRVSVLVALYPFALPPGG